MRKFKRILLSIIGIYVVLLALTYTMQEKLIFLPEPLEPDYKFNFQDNFEEFTLTSNDGAKLNALHFKVENPKGLILYFHGNAGSLRRWGTVASYFTKFSYDVVVMDYRGFGKSTGKRSEALLYQDAQQFYEYALELFSEKDIILYGRSLGTGIASYLASKNTPKQLILETPFYSLVDVAKRRFPILPVETLLRYKFPSHKFLKSASCSIAIFQGTEDNIVPFASAKKLAKSIPNDQINFITVEGGKHKNLSDFKIFEKSIKQILK